MRHDRGRIIEENHYYAYGLRINAISSKAYGGQANYYLYKDDFAELDEDLGWTDFMLRSYDAEIGRFLQEDPMNEFASGYFGMGGDPANLIDPTGGCVYCETAEKAMTLAEVTVTFVKKASTASNITKAINLTVAFGNGLWNGAKGTYEFISSDMWKQQTWTQLGNVAMSLAIAHANNGLPSGKMAMIYIDQKLGTSYYFTYDALTSQITNFVERAPNMSAEQWAELSGEATFSILGTKGLNAIKGSKLVKVVTNNVVTSVGNKAKNVVYPLISNAGEILGDFGIPRLYNYTIAGKSVHVSPHAMKHLEELLENGRKLGPGYLKLLGQLHQKALHSAIDDVLSRGPIKYDIPYYSGGNKIIFGAPRKAGELPAVKHFSYGNK